MKLKIFVKKFPPIWNLLRGLKDILINIYRLKDVFIMMALFHVWPEQIYRFSTRKLLPSKKDRFEKPKKIEPYKIINNKSKMKKLGKINLVTKGSSFNINNLGKLKGKTFFTPGYQPLKTDQKGNIYSFKFDKKLATNWIYEPSDNIGQLKDYAKKKIIYCTDRKESLDKYLKKGYNFFSATTYYKKGKFAKPISKYWESKSYKNLFKYKNLKRVALLENFSNTPTEHVLPKWAPSGSTIPVLFALSKYAKKINVYGWDFYLEKSPAKMSYWEVFFNLYKYKLDVLRSKNHFESALFNFYFGYQFSKLPNFNTSLSNQTSSSVHRGIPPWHGKHERCRAIYGSIGPEVWDRVHLGGRHRTG